MYETGFHLGSCEKVREDACVEVIDILIIFNESIVSTAIGVWYWY